MNCTATCKLGGLVVKPGHAIRCVSGAIQLGAFFQYPDGEDQVVQGLVWSSSDTGVAVVDGAGLVTCVGRGEAVISAVWHDYQGFMGLAVLAGASCCEQVYAQVAVLLDNSISMKAEFGAGYPTRLEAAKAICRGLADGVQTKDTQTLLSFHEVPYTLQVATNDREALKQAVSDVEQTDRLTDLLSALTGALRTMQAAEQVEAVTPPYVPPVLTYMEYTNLY